MENVVVIEVMGGCVVDVWSRDGGLALIIDHDTGQADQVAVNEGIPDFALKHLGGAG